jgi:hypothetical protein
MSPIHPAQTTGFGRGDSGRGRVSGAPLRPFEADARDWPRSPTLLDLKCGRKLLQLWANHRLTIASRRIPSVVILMISFGCVKIAE